MTAHFELPDLAATDAFAKRLVDALPKPPGGWLLLLRGELGSGKSTLARAMLRQYGFEGAVPSPTYTLIEPYTFSQFILYHIDLYRIESTEELDYLGWPDLEQGFRIVEWPERVPGLAEVADVEVLLRYQGDGRTADVSSRTARGKDFVRALGD